MQIEVAISDWAEYELLDSGNCRLQVFTWSPDGRPLGAKKRGEGSSTKDLLDISDPLAP